MTQRELFLTNIHLRCIDPARNKRRVYGMSVQCTLFEEWALVREWGRIGSSSRLRSDLYPAVGPAIDALLDLVQEKAQRGYHAVAT